jgi:DNA-binding NarL/FixJ family response regulator
VYDQVFFCEGLNAILGTAPDVEVVGMAYDGEEALQLVEKLQPDLVLMDLKMLVLSGVQATRQIHQRFRKSRYWS